MALKKSKERARMLLSAMLAATLAGGVLPLAAYAEEPIPDDANLTGAVEPAPASDEPAAPEAGSAPVTGTAPSAEESRTPEAEPEPEAPAAASLAATPAPAAAAPLAAAAPAAIDWQGSGTQADPYRIADEAGLRLLAQKVNGGEAYDGMHFKLVQDIALSGGWTPIGTASNQFKGMFDGGSKTIDGLFVSIEQEGDVYAGLFGSLGGTGAQVHDLTVKGSVRAVSTGAVGTQQGEVYAGLVVGYAGDNVVIENVTAVGNGVYGEAQDEYAPAYLGGMGGWIGSAKGCVSRQNAVLSGKAGYHLRIGGAFGHLTKGAENVQATIAGIDARNAGTMAEAGGVVGAAGDTLSSCTAQSAGDIAAEGQGENTTAAGGVVAIMGGIQGAAVTSCSANVRGSVTAVSHGQYGIAAAGGIGGYSFEMHIVDAAAIVAGDVSAENRGEGHAFAGGVGGTVQYGIYESGSSVAGDVTARSASPDWAAYAGGLAGYAGTIDSSASWVGGSVVAEGNAWSGGLAGRVIMSAIGKSACTVDGSVRANAPSTLNAYAGGAVGGSTNGLAYKNVITHIAGDVEATGTAKRYAGGIVGFMPKRSGSSAHGIAEVAGTVKSSAEAGGITGYVENNGSVTFLMDSVALVNAVEGSRAFRVADAKNLDGSTFAPLLRTYALASAQVNGAVIPNTDPEWGSDRRHGADWPVTGMTWEQLFLNDPAWIYSGSETPQLVAEKEIADKLGRVPTAIYLASVDPAIEHGTIALSPAGLVDAGTKVSVTVAPDEGYKLVDGSLSYRAPNDAAAGTPIVGGEFAMPANDVVVTAEFEPVAQPTPEPTPAPAPTDDGGKLANTGDASAPAMAATAALAAAAAVAVGAAARRRRKGSRQAE